MAEMKPDALRARLSAGGELALLDIREPGEFQAGHLLLASNAPLSRLELIVHALVPRQDVTVVLCAGDSEDLRLARAVEVMRGLGYQGLRTLSGGVAEWARLGHEVFTGFNVPSKAYGEWLEAARGTPSMDARTLHARVQAGEVVVIDCRPADEHARGAVPGAINLPGVELVRHFASGTADRGKPVVIHCAGRTRGIVATQSVIDHGYSEPVFVLENGLIGWQLAGFELAKPQAAATAPVVRGAGNTIERARAHAARSGVRLLDEAAFARLQAERTERSLFCFDVRTQPEFEANPLPGFCHVPGGQLVQALDDHVGVLGARIVLADPELVRAVSAAVFVKEMGAYDVHVLDPATLPAGDGWADAAQGPPVPNPVSLVATGAAWEMLQSGARVVDLGNGRRYRSTHPPGAEFGVRSLLHRYADRLRGTAPLLLVCDDGRLSALAAPEFERSLGRPVAVLEGGVEAWAQAGLPTTNDLRLLSDTIDVATTPYDYTDDLHARMQAYIDWELGLVAQVERDGLLKFGQPWPRGAGREGA